MTARALIALLLLHAAAAHADACDAGGRYDVTISFGPHKCTAPDSWAVRLLVLPDGSVRDAHGARFAVTAKAADNGTCRVRVVETVDHYTQGSGPADFVRFDLDLSVAGGQVKGGGGYQELGPDAQAAASCTDQVTVEGTRMPLTPADLRFDEAAARRDLVETFQAMAETCDLPYFEKPRRGSVKVDALVAPGGGASGFKLAGLDQKLDTTCPGFERSFANRFHNPSDKAQAVRVTVDLAQVHPRPKAKDLIVIPADRDAIATDEKSCLEALPETKAGVDEALRAAAKDLCALRVKHKEARDRLLAAMARIVKEYRDDTNHDHAQNLPKTMKALGDIVKDCVDALESQEWCHNVRCVMDPEENAAFCDARAADVADAIVKP